MLASLMMLSLSACGGDAEIQFGVEKTSDTQWTMDFSNASCKKLS